MSNINSEPQDSTAFEAFLKKIVSGRDPNRRDILNAFSIVATIYIEDSLNLVNEAVSEIEDPERALQRADLLFTAWQNEISSVQASIRLTRTSSHD